MSIARSPTSSLMASGIDSRSRSCCACESHIKYEDIVSCMQVEKAAQPHPTPTPPRTHTHMPWAYGIVSWDESTTTHKQTISETHTLTHIHTHTLRVMRTSAGAGNLVWAPMTASTDFFLTKLFFYTNQLGVMFYKNNSVESCFLKISTCALIFRGNRIVENRFYHERYFAGRRAAENKKCKKKMIAKKNMSEE